mgnify:FL=1
MFSQCIMHIYKISSPNTDLIYVGMTRQTISRRLRGHHSHRKRYLANAQGAHFCSSYRVLECGDATIESIEETDDHRREGFWIEELNSCNKLRMQTDWTDPVEVAKTKHAYYVVHRDETNAFRNTPISCSKCGSFVSRRNIARHKKINYCISYEALHAPGVAE